MTCELKSARRLQPQFPLTHSAHRRFEKAERELARAMAIGHSLKTRQEVLEQAEELCAEVVNMIKARLMLCLQIVLVFETPAVENA